MFKSLDSAESKAEYKQLEKAEKLYLKAVESAGYKYSNRKIVRTKRDEVDVQEEIQYNKKTPYIQWKSDALAWANNPKTKVGDVELNNERNNTSIYERLNRYESEREKYQSNHSTSLGEYSRNGQSDSLHQRESESNGERNTQKGNRSGEVKYSLKDTVEKDVLKHYGKTYRWSETGYIFKDGTRLDLSGRAEGASGGYRAVDHRDIFDILEDNDTEDKIIQFNEWVKKNFKEGKLTATEEEIVRAAVQISKA